MIIADVFENLGLFAKYFYYHWYLLLHSMLTIKILNFSASCNNSIRIQIIHVENSSADLKL